MLEWDVLDGDKNEGLGEPQQEGPQGAGIIWWRWLLLLFVIVLAVIIWLGWQSQVRDQQLRTDLNVVLQEEIYAQASGFTGRAADLADPGVSQSWFARYVDLFRRPYSVSKFPIIQDIILNNSIIITLVEWPQSQAAVIEQRAYRLVNSRWRRTPLPSSFIEPATPKEERRTTYFMLRGAAQDMATMTDDPELRLNLEALRSRVVTYWPNTWDSFFLVLNIEPQELSPAVYFMDAQKLYINRYELVPFDPSSPLSRKGQYRLAVIQAVVEWLTTPSLLRDKEIRNAQTELPAEFAASKDWIILYRLLQQAEARYWALDGSQRRELRNAWRAELAGEWSDPFAGALPFNPDLATPEERKRWLILNLLIERQIALKAIGTAGRLATSVQGYLPQDFNMIHFFQGVIGAEIDEFERITSEYVLGTE